MYILPQWFWVAGTLKTLKQSGAGLAPLGVLHNFNPRVVGNRYSYSYSDYFDHKPF